MPPIRESFLLALSVVVTLAVACAFTVTTVLIILRMTGSC